MTAGEPAYDAIVLVSFGGPERREDVMPFLENVLRGRNVPRERMLEVAEHYYHFDGVSPINQQNRELLAALEKELDQRGPRLKVYWGNRNWHPLLTDVMQQMADDGVQRALAFFTSAFSSYSGCRQYRENIQAAREAVGPRAPRVDKVRVFYNHPAYVDVMAERVSDCLPRLGSEQRVKLLFTAHSIPLGMAAGCNYEKQLRESCRLVAERFPQASWELVYQSRSGPASQPWLEPDVGDALKAVHASGAAEHVVIVPIGFISDHMEVLYDLDHEAAEICRELPLAMTRAKTAGTHPKFISMIRDLLVERIEEHPIRPALGDFGPSHDVCPVDCCLSGRPVGPPPGVAAR